MVEVISLRLRGHIIQLKYFGDIKKHLDKKAVTEQVIHVRILTEILVRGRFRAKEFVLKRLFSE